MNVDIATDDLSSLAWVHDELRRSLESAHKSLRRYLKEVDAQAGADIDATDPAVLRTARQQIHQGVGALELVGLPTAAQMLRGSEAALQKLASKSRKLDSAAIDTLERASFALLDYLARRLAGKPVPAIAMFPQYRAVLELAGAERIHPADLWHSDWSWHEVPMTQHASPRAADGEARVEFEGQLLGLMRGDGIDTATKMIDFFDALAAGAPNAPTRALWQLAATFFESQSRRAIVPDNYSKRVASRLLAQLRACERGAQDISERLAQDLLFFCAQAGAPKGPDQPRLKVVREHYRLDRTEPTHYDSIRLGRFDPAWIAQAKKRIAAAKDSWSAVAGGELHRLSGLAEQFALVGESLGRLHADGEMLAQALAEAVSQTVQDNEAPVPELAMEVATAVLSVEATLEDAEFDHPEQGTRMRQLAERIHRARRGEPAGALDRWMEDLYRRVSDRQTMGSVVHELRSTLGETERAIDEFFRNPQQRASLVPVPQHLASMRGVLSVLGIDSGAHAVLRMRDEVEFLLAPSTDPERAAGEGRFERLAGNLGALGFLIDMLSVQPHLAKSLFVFDAEAGTLSPLMGRRLSSSTFGDLEAEAPLPAASVDPDLVEHALSLAVSAINAEVPTEQVADELSRVSHEAELADQGELALSLAQAGEHLKEAGDAEAEHAARDEIAEVLSDFVVSSSEPVGLDLEIESMRSLPLSLPPLTPAPAAPAATGLEEDDEMREVFLEEAREVLQAADEAIAALAENGGDIHQLTTVRRAFHTLKGSSRMVGLGEFGEAAWACEQLYNARLADQPRADAPLIDFTMQALAYLGDWVEAISQRRSSAHAPAVVVAAADALRLEGRSVDLALPVQAPVEAPAALAPMPALPSAADLDLRAMVESLPQPDPVLEAKLSSAFEADAVEAAAAAEPAFELDLSLPDEVLAVAPGEPQPAEQPEVPSTLLSLDLSALEEAAVPPADEAPIIESIELPDVVLDDEVPAEPSEDHVRQIGDLKISIPLFNIYLGEADELSRRLDTEIAEWAHELHRGPGESAAALAHSLAGSSATVGYADLSHLARQLEHALHRVDAIGRGNAEEAALFVDAAQEVRRLLNRFAAGFLESPVPELLQRLEEHELESAVRLDAMTDVVVAEDSAALPLQPEAQSEPAASEQGAQPASVFEEPVAEEPVAEVPVAEVPIAEVPVAEVPVAEVPVAEVPVAEVPVAASSPLTEPVPETGPVSSEPPAVEPQPVPAPAEPAAAEVALTTFTTFGRAELRPLVEPLPVHPWPVRSDADDDASLAEDEEIDAVDAIDPELFAIFEEEAHELLPQLAASLRDWLRRPADSAAATRCMRTLHTLKGGARLAGAMRLGEMAHRLESSVEHLVAREALAAAAIEPLQARADAIGAAFEALRRADIAEPAPVEPAAAPVEAPPEAVAYEPETAADAASGIDWSAYRESARQASAQALPAAPAAERAGAGHSVVRVRASLLERMINHAGEVSLRRARIDTQTRRAMTSLGDLNDNLERLRTQLRDLELQAESQISSRLEAARAHSQEFDPLEMDRFTRFQELTRMMAESVNDVATVQRNLLRSVQATEDELAAQSRLTRDLQDDLLRTRMVEFESLSERLYRVVRLASKETGKHVRLDIVGGSIEVDRGVLERMTGAFEHLLRNCVTHGIEAPEVRGEAGKDPTGTITVTLGHEGNEVTVEVRDDGRGLDLLALRGRGVAMGLLDDTLAYSDAELANLIFTPGVSTAQSVTELAGRGIGMDVVRNEIAAIGGRIETATAWGKGTSFRLVMPLTTAVTQVVMLRAGSTIVAVPSTLIESTRSTTLDELEQAYASGHYASGEHALPFFWLGALLQSSARGDSTGETAQIAVIRSAQQRVAIHVDEVLGNQEVVVKNLGVQLARLPGLVGITLLASGAVALIYNPVALAATHGDSARRLMFETPQGAAQDGAAAEEAQPPLVLVVDDSLTVRRVTQRLLAREGYRVAVAKDGVDALEKLAQERPTVMLSDIEMPRMDGFELVRQVRADARLADLPVIMITSRIAQKHRDYAGELGVDHYLGKPYSEEELLGLVARYAGVSVAI